MHPAFCILHPAVRAVNNIFSPNSGIVSSEVAILTLEVLKNEQQKQILAFLRR